MTATPTAAPEPARLTDLEAKSAETLAALRAMILHAYRGRIALVSSFGAESAVLLHMVSRIDPATPVLFIDTELLFAETLAYQTALGARLGLSDIRRIAPDLTEAAAEDPEGDLNRRDPDACCDLRKTRPLARALDGFDAWITGRKRHQNATRRALTLFEEDAGRIKINPLAAWDAASLIAYMKANGLPPHPLVSQGYPSIGCAPCTSPVAAGEDPRAGRWRGAAKTECGIHLDRSAAARA